MGIAKSLRKSGRLSMLAKGLADVFSKLNEDDSENEYLKQVADTKQKVGGRFQPQPNQEKAGMIGNVVDDPFMQLGSDLRRQTAIGPSFKDDFFQGGPSMRRETALQNIEREPNEKVDFNKAGSQSLTDIAEFVMSSLGKKGVDPNLMKSAVEGLSLYRSSLIPGKEETPKLHELSEGERLVDATGKVIVDSQKKDKGVSVNDKFKGISGKGYWEVDYSDPANPQMKWVENKDYKSDAVGGGDEYKDPSKLLGDISEAISKVQLIKSAKQGKDGLFTVPDPYGLGTYQLNQEELTTLKEQVKNRYTSEAVTLTTQQGLQSAVEDIRSILDKNGKNLEGAIAKFKELNPDIDEDQLRILEDYFTLLLL